jgi:hypothetical protein
VLTPFPLRGSQHRRSIVVIAKQCSARRMIARWAHRRVITVLCHHETSATWPQ